METRRSFNFRTSISRHVTVNFQWVSILLRVDPVLSVSNGVSRVPDVFAGIPGLRGEMAKLLYKTINKHLIFTLTIFLSLF